MHAAGDTPPARRPSRTRAPKGMLLKQLAREDRDTTGRKHAQDGLEVTARKPSAFGYDQNRDPTPRALHRLAA